MTDYTIPGSGGGMYSYAQAIPIPPPPPSQNPLFADSTSQQNEQQHHRHQQTPMKSDARFSLSNQSSIISQDAVLKLKQQGYSNGYIELLGKTKRAFPLRIWIIDNSGSMRNPDGNRIIVNNHDRNLKIVSGCTRWAEMQQTIEYHAQLVSLIEAPTIFRLLNDPGIVAGPQQFTIAYSKQNDGGSSNNNTIDSDLKIALQTMNNANPGGVTPLTRHIQEIRNNIIELLPQLQSNGTKVAVVVATDGLPSDDQGYSTESVKYEFEQAIKSLEGLPVWIVVKLCTDEEDIVEYWSNIDTKVEVSIEVLDDFVSEAREICTSYNRWLNYGLPLHRIREMGCHDTLLDLLDERKLSKDELRKFCGILFGEDKVRSIPDPDIDWDNFYKCVSKLLINEQKQWNPIRKRVEPWIDMKTLQKEYGPRSFFSMFNFEL